jgi:hypothetical protein
MSSSHTEVNFRCRKGARRDPSASSGQRGILDLLRAAWICISGGDGEYDLSTISTAIVGRGIPGGVPRVPYPPASSGLLVYDGRHLLNRPHRVVHRINAQKCHK